MRFFITVAFILFGIAQLIAGFQGIADGIGNIWAIIIFACCFIFRFNLPITVGAFFGAMNVWGWHWSLSLLFAVPGLIFIVPHIAIGIIDSISNRFR